MSKTIKWGSDFSGVGAADYALKRLSERKGFNVETVYACDWDKYARVTYQAAHGTPPYYPKDVYEREIPKDSLDLYVTSPPCQAFSLAGKRLGKDDKRGILFFNSHEFIQENKPRFFIFENVKGLLSDDGGKTFQEWVNMLGGKSVNGVPILFPYEESVPYHLYWKVINAKHHGIPQNRERVFLIGIRDNQDNKFSFPVEEHLTKRLKDVLEDNVDDKYYLSEKMIKGFIEHSERHKEKGTGFQWNPKDENDLANCLNARGSALGVTDNTLKVGFINQDTQASAIYDEKGVSQTMTAGTHGYAMGYVQVSNENAEEDPKIADYRADEGLRIRKEGISPCMTSSMQDYPEWNPKARTRNPPLVIEKDTKKVLVSKEVRTEESKKKRKETGTNDFRGKEIEFREQDSMNTITTSLTNDHLLKIKTEFNDKRLTQTVNKNNFTNGVPSAIDSYNQSVSEIIAPTVKLPHNDRFMFDGYKIRRLTPIEAFRLMDFPDEIVHKAREQGMSDSQLYKQAGNSIVVRVLEKIIDKLPL